MAFIAANLKKTTPSQLKDIQERYTYQSTDSFDDILSEGYFLGAFDCSACFVVVDITAGVGWLTIVVDSDTGTASNQSGMPAAADVAAATTNANILLESYGQPPEMTSIAAFTGLKAIKSGDNYSCNLTPQDLIDFTLFSNVLYVDSAAANNSSDGSTWALAKKAIGAAVDAAIASGLPTRIKVKAGVYSRFNSIMNTSPPKVLTAPITIEAVYGRVETGPFEALTWTQNVTYSTVYQVSRSVAQQIYNTQLRDQNGEYLRYTHVADLATCAANAGTWYTDNSTVYVQTHNQAPANDKNARVFLASRSCAWEGNQDIYLSGIDCQGGDTGAGYFANGSTNTIVVNDCTFKYAANGNQSGGLSGVNGVTILGCKLFAAFNSEASYNSKDGFNAHDQSGNTPSVLTVNCRGFQNGTMLFTEQSCNGLTVHDGVKCIDIGGKWLGNVGTSSGHVNDNTEYWGFGVTAGNSDGDIIAGGTVNWGAFGVWTGASKMWLEHCKDIGASIGVYAAVTANAYIRNHAGSGDLVNTTEYIR